MKIIVSVNVVCIGLATTCIEDLVWFLLNVISFLISEFLVGYLRDVWPIILCNTFTPQIKGICSATNLTFPSPQGIIMILP